jgi:prevent-host-death family protein
MNQISIFDAKNKLSALLDQVERGNEFVITRRGKPVARLVPATPPDRTQGAAARLKRLRADLSARGVKLSWEELKSYRDEGRQ